MKRIQCINFIFILLLGMMLICGNAFADKEYTIQIDADLQPEEIHIVERGQGDNIILAWHGGYSNNYFLMWDKFLPDYKVILVGLPGHGPIRSYDRSHYLNWTTEHWVEVGVKVAEKFYNGKPMTLIGYSFGALPALGIASQKPKLVKRLILLTPTIFPDFHGLPGMAAKVGRWPSFSRFIVGMGTKPGYKKFKKYKKDAIRFFTTNKKGAKNNPETEISLKRSWEALRKSDIKTIIDSSVGTAILHRKNSISSIVEQNPPAMPTLIIKGDKDKTNKSTSHQDFLLDKLPNAELILVPNSGHMLFFENERDFYELLNRWIKKNL